MGTSLLAWWTRTRRPRAPTVWKTRYLICIAFCPGRLLPRLSWQSMGIWDWSRAMFEKKGVDSMRGHHTSWPKRWLLNLRAVGVWSVLPIVLLAFFLGLASLVRWSIFLLSMLWGLI